MPLDPQQQVIALLHLEAQVTLGDVVGALNVTPAPGIAEGAEVRLDVAAPEGVDHHQQVGKASQP